MGTVRASIAETLPTTSEQNGAMATVDVMLEDWEHLCCGDRRSLGDEVTLRVFRAASGDLYEIRHDSDDPTRPPHVRLHGRLTAIALRLAIVEHLGGVSYRIAGYGAPVPCATTDAGDEVEPSYAFVFSVATDDPLPPVTSRRVDDGASIA
jgi:hypothetical protein